VAVSWQLAKLGGRLRFKCSASLILLEKHLADIDPLTLVLSALRQVPAANAKITTP